MEQGDYIMIFLYINDVLFLEFLQHNNKAVNSVITYYYFSCKIYMFILIALIAEHIYYMDSSCI
jgi:hypothetical protein